MPQIFSDLRRVFPPTAGRHVVGPMVQLRWGSPTCSRSTPLLVECRSCSDGCPRPSPSPVAGQTIRSCRFAWMPSGLGSQCRTVSLDATLYDSRILQFTLTGDMACGAGWGRQPQFVLAIGGCHPRFAPRRAARVKAVGVCSWPTATRSNYVAKRI